MKFKVSLFPSEEGFAVCTPSLPGCWSQGATEAEALANIASAIREYLEAEIDPKGGAEIREIDVAVWTRREPRCAKIF
jgi:predicted RNase H-like HicB family nuclease